MHVAVCNNAVFTHSTLALGRFFCKDVTFESFLECNFTCTGNFKALFCAAVGFNLWHVINVVITPCWRPKQMGTYGAVWEIVQNECSFRAAKVRELSFI